MPLLLCACRGFIHTPVQNLVTGQTGTFEAVLAATPLGRVVEARNAARQEYTAAEAAVVAASDEVRLPLFCMLSA